MLHQIETKLPQCAAHETAPARPRVLRVGHTTGWRAQVVAGGLMLGAFSLGACSQDAARRENSEMRVDAPTATRGAESRVPAATTAVAAAPPTGPLPGASGRYRVAVETAYFFDNPEQSTPNGRYLRRGDTFYGEGETNGFVKTGFVQPNGTAGIAWLKLSELRKFAAGAAAASPRISSPRQVPHTTAAPAPISEDHDETRGAAEAESIPERHAGTAVVQVARAYFYQSPDLLTPRKAFCQRGDKVRLGETQGAAVYVTFTNWEKVTTTGWMRKEALR